MRLIYPVLWSRPGTAASQEQTVKTAAALARRGIDVTLLVPRGRDDATLDAEEVRQRFRVEGDFALVQRPSRWAGESLVRSRLWLRQAFAEAEAARADLLYSRIPAMLALAGASPLPFATDHYRPWPDQWPWLRPLIRRTARRRRCLGLILHSDYAAASYRRAGVPDDRLLVAHNGAELVSIGRAEARASLGLPADRTIAVYAGRVSADKGLDQLLALADLRPETLFLLVGSEGPGPVEAEAAARSNVAVFPWQPPDGLAGFLAAADVLIVPPSSAPLRRSRHTALPMKALAYLGAGRPILAPRLPDTAELLRDGDNALLVEPDRPEAAAAALDRLRGEPGLAGRLATRAAATAACLSWDSRAEKIARFLERRLHASV